MKLPYDWQNNGITIHSPAIFKVQKKGTRVLTHSHMGSSMGKTRGALSWSGSSKVSPHQTPRIYPLPNEKMHFLQGVANFQRHQFSHHVGPISRAPDWTSMRYPLLILFIHVYPCETVTSHSQVLFWFEVLWRSIETSVPLEPGRDHGPFVISSDLILNDICSSYFIIIIIIQKSNTREI